MTGGPPLCASTAPLEIELNAAIVAVRAAEPVVLVVRPLTGEPADRLPYGPFAPLAHRTLEIGLRAWVTAQTSLTLGYVEQLYTFGDRGRHAQLGDTAPHVVSIGYLALTRPLESSELGGDWQSWYSYFPWEDWRRGRPVSIGEVIEPRLRQWAAEPVARDDPTHPLARADRVDICFGLDGTQWDDEKVLERYELLYEAGLIEEALHDGREAARRWDRQPALGRPMRYDHRRVLATALGRLRAKIKYRPVVFELMADEFTLFELQRTVEAILGPQFHKQNFRRLVEAGGLVEETGAVNIRTGGRPAKVFRFRPEVLLERPFAGLRLGPPRG